MVPGLTVGPGSRMPGAHSPLKIGNVIGHTPFPAPAKPDGAAKGQDPLVGYRHGRQGTAWSVASRSTVAFHSSRLPLFRPLRRARTARVPARYLGRRSARVNPGAR